MTNRSDCSRATSNTSILATHPDYDVSPDGQHFYMIRGEQVEAESRLRVVVGWLDSVAGGDIDSRHLTVSFFSDDGDFKSNAIRDANDTYGRSLRIIKHLDRSGIHQ